MPYKDPEQRRAYLAVYLPIWRKDNREHTRAYERVRYRENYEKRRLAQIKWASENEEHLRLYNRTRRPQRASNFGVAS